MEKLRSTKKMCFLGSGAVGSFFGGILSYNGYNVELIARGKHFYAILADSSKLRIKSIAFGDIKVDVNIKAEPDGLYDAVFISVKSKDTVAACEMLKNHIHRGSIIVSLQNGVDNYNIVKSFFPENITIAGIVYAGLHIEPAGTVNHTAAGKITLGSDCTIPNTLEALDELKGYFDISKVPCVVDTNIRQAMWKKLLWNIVFNPLSAILSATCGKMYDDDGIRSLMRKMAEEGVRAAGKDGVTIEDDFLDKLITVEDSVRNYKTSMLQDIEKLRNPEIDGILKPVLDRLSDEGGAPYCETIYKLIDFKYGKRFIYPPRLTVDVLLVNSKNEVLLIERLNPPYGWAIPGGFVDYGEEVEAAAVRELLEETSIKADEIFYLGVYSDPKRDIRGHTVSVVYYAFSNELPLAADDAKNASFFGRNELPEIIAFDHRLIIDDFYKTVKL